MDVLYLAFSNSQTEPLPSLQSEYTKLQEILLPRAYRQHFFLDMQPFATIPIVCQAIASHRERLIVFHYSGHAGRDNLLLNEELARAEGLVQLLGKCPRLRVVLLNGCSTYGMVQALLKAGIPAVLATSSKVDDLTATNFSVSLYKALEQGDSLENAFTMAKGHVLTMADIPFYRGILEPETEQKQGQWGLYFNSEKASDFSLPQSTQVVQSPNFTPNQELLETLYTSLATIHPRVRDLKQREDDGEYIPEGDKQKEILNALPIPIAEHLRKLLCPVEVEADGFDTVSLRRLEQTTTVYQMAMEFLAFILISQIWEVWLQKPEAAASLPRNLKEGLRRYVDMPALERKVLDYVPFLLQLREYLDVYPEAYFVEELRKWAAEIIHVPEYASACEYLSFLRRQTVAKNIAQGDIPEMCQRAEHSLSKFLSELCFLAQYTLASVKHIDIQKFRHQQEATYNHAIVKLMRVMGKLEVNRYVLDKFLDNRGVMLVKDAAVKFDSQKKQFLGGNVPFLNLAPFVMDENAFIENTDISKLYFFSFLDRAKGTYYYKYVKKPEEDTPLEVSLTSKFDIVKEQFDAFLNRVLAV